MIKENPAFLNEEPSTTIEKSRGKYKKVPVNVDEIQIDTEASKDKRIQSFIKQAKNPYLLKIDGVVVEMAYAAEGPTMSELIELIGEL